MEGVNSVDKGGVGENSNDECCMCDAEWVQGCEGWVLCDTSGCENCVCPTCTSALSLSVSELFFCPICAGSGESAAATAGGAVATAVAACAELEKLPLSFNTTKKILSNVSKHPNDPKYRKLRLENKSVKRLVDLEPVLNILTSIGFVRTQCARQTKPNEQSTLPATEEVLLLEGPVPKSVNELLEIIEGMSPERKEDANDACSNAKEMNEKRKSDNASKESISGNKKQRADKETSRSKDG